MINKLITFLISLVQMSLFMWFWGISGLEWKGKFKNIIVFILLSAFIIAFLLPQTSILGHYTRYMVYVTILFISKVIFDKNFKEVTIDLFSIFSIYYFIQSLQILLYRAMYSTIDLYYLNVTSLSNIFIMNILFFIFILIVYSSNNLIELFIEYKRVLANNPSLIVVMSLTIALMQAIWDLYSVVLWQKYYIVFPIIWILFALNFVGVKKSLEASVYEKGIELYKEHYKIISNLLEDARKRQHEYKNHLNTIYCLQQLEEKPDTVKKYIKSVCGTITSEILDIENRIIAAVIYNKSITAEENGIKFEYYVNDLHQIPLVDYQLVEVISNLLNNAIEALKETGINKKRVVFEMDVEDKKPYLLVKNNGKTLSPSEIPMIFNKGFSKKSRDRGYGLYNVKRIVKENSGKLEVFLDDEYTVFKIIF